MRYVRDETAWKGTIMNRQRRSPRIVSISWGRMEVEGLGAAKDFALFPGGGREWDWGESGTRHEPGIQVADVREIVQQGATTVVLARGMEQRLGIDSQTLSFLEKSSVQVIVDETRNAVEKYNRLAEDELVGGLFHSTC